MSEERQRSGFLFRTIGPFPHDFFRIFGERAGAVSLVFGNYVYLAKNLSLESILKSAERADLTTENGRQRITEWIPSSRRNVFLHDEAEDLIIPED